MPLVNKTFSDIITFSRASSATMFDSSGTLVYAPMNAIRNSSASGAVAGTPGTLPTNWNVFTNVTGLTRQIVGTGTEDGITYIEVKLSGTPSGSGIYQFQFEPSNAVAALTAQTWTASSYLKLQAGSYAGVSSNRFGFSEYTSGGVFVTFNTVGVASATSAALSTQRATATQTLNGGATTAFVLPFFELVLSGAAIDITLRIGLPQLELGSVARTAVATSGTAYQGPRLDYDPATLAAQGLLIEEQRTNSIRNNTGVGAVNGVIGSGGAVPTNWTSQINTTTGLTRQVVGTGTENGIAYVDFRLSGTATGAGSFDMFFEQANVAAALTGQTWAGSVFTKLVGGTTNGLSLPRFYLYELTSGAAFITAQVLSPGFSLPATGALNTQRYTGAATLSGGATTAFIRPLINYAIADGAAIDITLRIGLPQLELGAFATSVIPTTTTSLTRSADVASVNTLSPWFNSTEGTLYAEASWFGLSTNDYYAALNNGTSSNLIGLAVSSGGTWRFAVVSAGSTEASITSGAVTANTVFKHSGAYKVNDFAACVNGGSVGTDTGGVVPSGITTLSLNASHGIINQFNGYLRRVTYYPRKLSSAELQAITA